MKKTPKNCIFFSKKEIYHFKVVNLKKNKKSFTTLSRKTKKINSLRLQSRKKNF